VQGKEELGNSNKGMISGSVKVSRIQPLSGRTISWDPSEECMAGDDQDLVLCEFGSGALEKLLRAFTRQLHGVRHAEDPEYIHRMRVSSRRLRAAMPVFQVCFSRKEYKQWLREIRRVTRALGEARDLDVQILFLQAYRGRVDPLTYTIRPGGGTEDASKVLDQGSSSVSGSLAPDPGKNAEGIEYLSHLLKTKREAIQPRITNALDTLEQSGAINSMDTVFRATMKKRRKSTSKWEGKGVRPFAAASLSSALEELVSYEESLHQPDAKSEHHAMRIAAKRLRYRLEIFRPLYGKDISGAIRVTKHLQTLLGELHDCDVWIGMLPDQFERDHPGQAGTGGEPGVPPEVEAQIRAFIDDQKEYREILYNQAIRYWKRITGDAFFPALQETIKAGVVANLVVEERKTK
jgi:CHAD domain-containing protein